MASRPPKQDLDKDVAFLNQLEGSAAPVAELHRSNLLRFQVDELLQECCIASSSSTSAQHEVPWEGYARAYVQTIQSLLKQMPTKTLSKQDSTCPFSLQSPKDSLSVDLPPLSQQLHPIGTFSCNFCGVTNKRGNAHQLPLLDCAIVIPNNVWKPKDYLHHRYFDKRNLILWEIALYLSQRKTQVGTVEWRYMNGNRHLPCLILTHPIAAKSDNKRKKKKQKDNHDMAISHAAHIPHKVKFQLQLVIAMESLEWIPRPRFFPNRSNVKNNAAKSSPFYNAMLAQDGSYIEMTHTLEQQMEQLGNASHFANALVLCKIWALQRGFLRCHDGFNEMQLALLLVYLYRTKRANPRMEPLQVFTVLIKFVAELSTTMTRVLVIPRHDLNEAQTIAASEQAKSYNKQSQEAPLDTVHGDPITLVACFQQYSCSPLVLLDSTMRANYTGHLSPAYIRALAHQAQATVHCLQSTRVSQPFSYLFLKSARFWTCMDAFVRIPTSCLKHNSEDNDDNDDDLGSYENTSRKLIQVLGQALGDRVVDLRILSTGNGPVHHDGSDQIPTRAVSDSDNNKLSIQDAHALISPLGQATIVLGLKLNPDTCHRIVDRGPPADNAEATKVFLELWGKAAELRRFKDGAIVHAVVWNDGPHGNNDHDDDYVIMEGDAKTQGGIVERIVRHVVKTHFVSNKQQKKRLPPIQFLLRDLVSLVDGVQTNDNSEAKVFSHNSHLAHRNILTAFDSLSNLLRQHSAATIPVPGSVDEKQSRLGIPLAIDAVEPLSPSLRYSELFPPTPHPLLGGPRSSSSSSKKVSGAICSAPILIQIRFGRSSKWPSDIKAMGAAKTAMLVQLANGIEAMKKRGAGDGFDGPIHVAPGYLDLGYKGYSWRVVVRADPELYLLRALHKPSPQAQSLLKLLTRENIIAATHHSTIHAVHTAHASAGSVVRLAKRWLAAHLLSDLIPFEAIELLVAKVYSDRDTPLDAPSTAVAGFMRFLQLLATHDWARRPLVVDPQEHLDENDHSAIESQFEHSRGSDFEKGPPMFVISPNDKTGGGNEDNESDTDQPVTMSKQTTKTKTTWSPTFTQEKPEWVTLSRASALAKRSFDLLSKCLTDDAATLKDWAAIFHESATSLKSYSVLMRIDPNFVIDPECSSTGSDLSIRKSSEREEMESSYTRSMRNRFLGPKALRLKNYRNLQNDDDEVKVMYNFTPVTAMVESLRKKFGSLALFFYNDLAPEVVGMLWRPTSFVAQPFSVMHSEYARPIADDNWKNDTMVMTNMNDVMREMSPYIQDMVTNTKIIDDRSVKRNTTTKKRHQPSDDDSSSSDESDSE